MTIELLKPTEVDQLLRLPFGRAARLAKHGKLPHVLLPDGTIRFREADIARLLNMPEQVANAQNGGASNEQ